MATEYGRRPSEFIGGLTEAAAFVFDREVYRQGAWERKLAQDRQTRKLGKRR